ncbi:MAG: hypothetical protein LBU82_00370 [Treponema sp.]|jgi:hypothetical protein|nr:hypothetical protein [Treponema sp.]
MRRYFQTVTLGSFTWKDKDRLGLLFTHIRLQGFSVLAAHFLLIAVCLNFPVMFNIARADPSEFYSRLYGEAYISDMGEIQDFNQAMIENGYGRYMLLPMLGMCFLIIIIILAAFFLCAAFFLGISRMNSSTLNFRSRLALALFSSTLPAFASSVFGLFLPAVHILVFCLIVILITFQRSSLCIS